MSYDTSATSGTPAQPSPGWYPDPSGAPTQRWWDGSSWTERTYDPRSVAAQAAPRSVEPGTRVYTPWIWLIVGLPVLSLLSLFLFDFGDYFRQSFSSSLAPLSDPSATPDPFAGTGALFTPGYIAMLSLSWLIYAVSIVFAFLDRRELIRRGFDRPFHWAWTFLSSLVYVIGRSVIVKRRAGSGLAPMWWSIAITVLSLVISTAVIGSALTEVFGELSSSFPTAY